MKNQNKAKFLSPKETAEKFNLSVEFLRVLTKEWKYGKHYIDCRQTNGTRAVYRYNIEEIEKWFSTPPEMR